MRVSAAGQVTAQQALGATFFGEGTTQFEQKIYQLTWKNETGLIYHAQSLIPLGSFVYKGEGWGLTSNTNTLIKSDGSARITFHQPDNFAELRHITVRDDGHEVSRINELEWANGWLLANIWRSHWILLIDPFDGHVIAKVNLKGLLANSERRHDTGVLNGIAYEPTRHAFWVTGKRWPKRFLIRLIDASGNQVIKLF